MRLTSSKFSMKRLNLARRAFAWAIDKRLVELTSNPFADISVPKEDGDEDEGYQEGWYLDLDNRKFLFTLYDISTALDVFDRMEKWSVQFAMGAGLRLREAWGLHLADVHVDAGDPHVMVRFGSYDPIKERYRPPKGRKGERKPRKVPLWGPALVAARRWLEIRADDVRPGPESSKRIATVKHNPLDDGHRAGQTHLPR